MAISSIGPAFERLCTASRPRTIRTIREFAEQEFIIPKGKLRGTRWRADTSPFQGLLLDQMTHLQLHESDRRRWRTFAVTGCVQSGKSLVAFVLPIMYHLFEIVEPVIVGVPNIDEIGRDKWNNEILPAIQASRYSRFLPDRGDGSRGGFGSEIRFTNGATLKFMSGSGGDEKRSSYTARVLVATEVDKMDTAGEVSREADPISQLLGRLRSYRPEERIAYLECTVSIKEGCIWQQYSQGSQGRIAKQCPHCLAWVTPEREHLIGFEGATNEFEAERLGRFVCPECAETITEAERREMNNHSILVHRGQQVEADGTVSGELPPTYTLGYRWNGFDNHSQLTVAGLSVDEWRAAEAEDEEAAKKNVLQYIWATPYEPPEFDLRPLRYTEVRERHSEERLGRDVVPDDTTAFVAAIDCGKRWLHWGVCAWRPESRGQLVAYGAWENPPCEGDEARHAAVAILAGLEQLRDKILLAGFESRDGRVWLPQQVLVDAGYQPEAIYAFAAEPESDDRFRPTIGRGSNQHDKRYRHYSHPKKTSSEIVLIGEEYHIAYDQERAAFRLETNADHWKVQLFHALQAPQGGRGALEFYRSTNPREHNTLAKHLAAERPVETFVPGRGRVTQWVTVSDTNHYLDVLYMCCVAGHLTGVRVIGQPEAPMQETEIKGSVVTMPDGRPFVARR